MLQVQLYQIVVVTAKNSLLYIYSFQLHIAITNITKLWARDEPGSGCKFLK